MDGWIEQRCFIVAFAETNGYYAGPPIEQKKPQPAQALRPPKKQGSSFLAKWCSDSFIGI